MDVDALHCHSWPFGQLLVVVLGNRERASCGAPNTPPAITSLKLGSRGGCIAPASSATTALWRWRCCSQGRSAGELSGSLFRSHHIQTRTGTG